jgi:hypothetical protein
MEINVDKIFSTFDDKNVEDLKVEFLNDYLRKNIRCYNNYILNFDDIRIHLNISIKILNPESNISFDKENQKFIFYMRSFNHLKKIDELFNVKSRDKNILNSFLNPEFFQASKLLLEYFEKQELYENCYIIKTYLDLEKLS